MPELMAWEQVVVDLMRQGIRFALRNRSISWTDLNELFRYALISECGELSLTQAEQALLLDASRRTVSEWHGRAASIHEHMSPNPLIARVLREIDAHTKAGRPPFDTATLWQWAAYNGPEPVPEKSVASLLLKLGFIVEEEGAPGHYQRARGPRAASVAWESPLGEGDQDLADAQAVLEEVMEAPGTLSQLSKRPNLKGFGRAHLQRILILLVRQGAVEASARTRSRQRSPIYTATPGVKRLQPSDFSGAYLSGFQQMTRTFRGFIDRVTGPDPEPFGQRVLEFKVRPVTLLKFIREHYAVVSSWLTDLEKQDSAEVDVAICRMVWATFMDPSQAPPPPPPKDPPAA